MNREENAQHVLQVNLWVEKTINERPPDVQLEHFARAIEALKSRTIQTLSLVTWEAILERALHQSQNEFPILNEVKIEKGKMLVAENLQHFISLASSRVTDAFRFFLVELLTILENLTAGILTEPLYKELARITNSALIVTKIHRGNK